MSRTNVTVTLCALVVSASLFAQEKEKELPALDKQRAQVRALADSVVVVEYTLKFDKGEAPSGLGYDDDYSALVSRRYRGAADEIISQERPLEVHSYLIGPDLVISQEMAIHERFIKSIEVRFKDQAVSAKAVAWAAQRGAVYLKLDKPLDGAKPLSFDATAKGPYTGLVATERDGSQTIQVEAFNPQVVYSKEIGEYVTMPAEAVIVNEAGVAAGMSMSPGLPVGLDWKGDPSKWERVTAEQRMALLEKGGKSADAGVVRVTLNFRSPKKGSEPGGLGRRGRMMDENGEEATERHMVGVLLENGRVIVPVSLKPNVTARLERITVHTADGKSQPASFVGSLKDYSAVVAQVKEPAGGVKLSTQPIYGFYQRVIPHARVEVRGEERVAYLDHTRISEYHRGWRRQVYPSIPDAVNSAYLFTDDGSLLAFPVARREKATGDERWAQDQPLLTPAVYLGNVLANLEPNLDPSNVPLSEEQENRVAWLGVVLQPLDRELARANKVAELTHDGATGALVNFVYPNSPAAEAGVEPGWILIRLHIEGNPKPVDVQVDGRAAGYAMPWDRFDDIPVEAFESAPQPWPPAENQLTTMLTEAGFGTKFTAEFFADGKLVSKEFTIAQSPAHFNSAARHKDDAAGLTVRDITFEVRNYFQLKDDDAGVIISRIEPGSKAAVAGVKPYELVTQINGQPVHNIKDFAALAKGEELRLTVQRMTRTRQVSIKLDAKPEKPAGDKPAAEKSE